MAVAPPSMPPLLWEPTQGQVESSNIEHFRKYVNRRYGLHLGSYDDLHRFSISELERFYESLWDWSGVRYSRKYDKIISDRTASPAVLPRFFEGALCNYAENVLFPIHPQNSTTSKCLGSPPRNWPPNNSVAIYEFSEGAPQASSSSHTTLSLPERKRTVTWDELRRRVAFLAEAFRRHGIRRGDRIAHLSSNTSHPIVTFLAASACGAVFSSLATDAGVAAIASRLRLLRPSVLLTDEFAVYNGHVIDVFDRVRKVISALIQEGVINSEARQLQVVRITNERVGAVERDWNLEGVRSISFQDFLTTVNLCDTPESLVPRLYFEPLPFNSPLLIVFSSGTTGEPKAIVHGNGPLLIVQKKEQLLQFDLHPGNIFLQVTTCGWIMWPILVSTMLTGSSVVTYDGSPLYPTPLRLLQVISHHGGVTGLGWSPRLMAEIERYCSSQRSSHGQTQLIPKRDFNLSKLRIVTATGSPLSEDIARYFYEVLAPPSTQLITHSGGTDLAGTFLSSAPTRPVRGHLFGSKTLGMNVRILDPVTGEDCEASGQPGELMCASPFPTQPLMFWGPQEQAVALHKKYIESYYRRFDHGPGVGMWSQGDFISRDLRTGGYEIHGRSDGVLNPSGVRFGSAEIYVVVENFEWVADSLVVGQRRPGRDSDERVLLFIKLRNATASLTEKQCKEIRHAIRTAYSPRHVPEHIFQVQDIPLTANGKKTELAVKSIVSGNAALRASTGIANPEVLDEYRPYAELEQVLAHQKHKIAGNNTIPKLSSNL